jgi:hypothetical protein
MVHPLHSNVYQLINHNAILIILVRFRDNWHFLCVCMFKFLQVLLVCFILVVPLPNPLVPIFVDRRTRPLSPPLHTRKQSVAICCIVAKVLGALP